ncbi:MAG: MOSC domain-containing protein, partial [Nocardioidaceae bacterium]
MHLASLRIYPVKSTRGIDIAAERVEPWGLEHDRRWMVVDSEGAPITARTHHRLLLVTATPQPDGVLTLTAQGAEPIDVKPPCASPDTEVTMSRLDRAVTVGAYADDWLSRHLRTRVRLVWLDDPRRRTVNPDHGGVQGDSLSLADAGPLLVTTTSSLDRLNSWVTDTAERVGETSLPALTMSRFRPNVVIEGVGEPFAEDGWRRLCIGDVEFRFADHCDRCVLTTIDPETLAGGKEPIRTL